jgi:hypothetical protein
LNNLGAGGLELQHRKPTGFGFHEVQSVFGRFGFGH